MHSGVYKAIVDCKKGLICLILFKLLLSFAGQRITAKDEEGYEQPLNGAEYHGQNAAALNAHSQVNIKAFRV